MKKEAKNYTGKAYAFFSCNASLPQMLGELPKIRQVAKIPSKLELSLSTGPVVFNCIHKEPALRELAQEANEAGLNYILEAKYPGKSNQEAADQVADVLNQAYQSPLYADGEKFFGDVLYRHRSKYVSRQ